MKVLVSPGLPGAEEEPWRWSLDCTAGDRGHSGHCQGDQSTTLQTCCRQRLVISPSPGWWQPSPQAGWKRGWGKEMKTVKSAIRGVKGRARLHGLGFQLVPPSLVLCGRGSFGCSNQVDLSERSWGMSEAGVWVAVGFLLCTHILPGERCRGGQRVFLEL